MYEYIIHCNTYVLSYYTFLTFHLMSQFFVLVVNENVSLVISRQILSDVSTQLLPDLPDAQSKLLAHFTLEKVRILP